MSVIVGARYIEGKWTGPTVLQVHAAESAGWKEARVELSYASMSERGPDLAGTSGVEEAPPREGVPGVPVGRNRAWVQNRLHIWCKQAITLHWTICQW